MIDLRLPLMAGIDIPFAEFGVTVHVPKIKEIAYMGEQNFFQASQYLCLQKESLIQDENLLSSVTNFQVLMKVLNQSQDKTKKKSIIMLLKLLFPQYTATLTKNSIILVQDGQNILIDDSNFNTFQEFIRQVLKIPGGSNQPPTYNPINAQAKAIADKLMKGRQKVAELKGGNKESVLTRYVSTLAVGVPSMSVEDCLNLNLFQLFDLMERYMAFVDWDTDLKIRLAGGSPKQQQESWMRDLHTL